MDLDSLYLLVTEAILKAETLDDLRAPGATLAHLDVSVLEEAIAEQVPASASEGALARRGAVRAAVAGGDLRRAEDLVDRYSQDADTTDDLRREMRELLSATGPKRDRAAMSAPPRWATRPPASPVASLAGPETQQLDLARVLGDMLSRLAAVQAELEQPHDHSALTSVSEEIHYIRSRLALSIYGVMLSLNSEYMAVVLSDQELIEIGHVFEDETTMAEFLEHCLEVADR